MGHLSSMFNGIVRSLSIKRTQHSNNKRQKRHEKEAVNTMGKNAEKQPLILRTSGIVNVEGSKNVASIYSKRGEKGVNQDCSIVWEEFGCQEDTTFCGIFDGHGPWGHFVAKRVRDSMPSTLSCNFQEMIAEASLNYDLDLESDIKLHLFEVWKHSYLKTCASIDQELKRNRKLDAVYSGTTALTIVRQGDLLYIANVGDSRAVLATSSDNGDLSPIQLTVDFKPNLPHSSLPFSICFYLSGEYPRGSCKNLKIFVIFSHENITLY